MSGTNPLPRGPTDLDRFLQTDPIGYEDDINLYAYVRNDPLNRSDPTGTCGFLIGACIGAGIEILFQAADPEARASYGRAFEAAASGDFQGALNESGGNLARIGIAAAAGQVGQLGTARLVSVGNQLARQAATPRTAEAIAAGGRVAAGAISGGATQGTAQAVRNEALGDNGSVVAATLGGAVGGAAGGASTLGARGGDRLLADSTGRTIVNSAGRATPAGTPTSTAATIGSAAVARGTRETFSCERGSSGCPGN